MNNKQFKCVCAWGADFAAKWYVLEMLSINSFFFLIVKLWGQEVLIDPIYDKDKFYLEP